MIDTTNIQKLETLENCISLLVLVYLNSVLYISYRMIQRTSLYSQIKDTRQRTQRPTYRLMISGYFNDDLVKKQNLNTEKYIRNSLQEFDIRGYLYMRGLFYIHILQSHQMETINTYLSQFQKAQATKKLHQEIRIVHQIYEDFEELFSNWDCDNTVQSGPILTETDKTEEQITDRSAEIYEVFEDGAKKKKEKPSHNIGTMILLSSDDMSILISPNFMNLQQYCEIYVSDPQIVRDEEQNYPLPPNIFNVIQFMETSDYEKFMA